MTSSLLNFPNPFTQNTKKKALSIHLLNTKSFKAWLKKQNKEVQSQVKQSSFTAQPKQVVYILDSKGAPEVILAGLTIPSHYLDTASIVQYIQNNFSKEFITKYVFKITTDLDKEDLTKACIGWGLAGYKFETYKKNDTAIPILIWPDKINKKEAIATINSISLLRNLINTPANDLGTNELATAAKQVATTHNAKVTIIKGEKLLEKNFPMIYNVGKASPRPPQLIDIKWGKKSDPKVTIVGKGIIYDTGGLNLKPGMYMRDMKKDMGGAAHALGVAWMIMALRLPVQLRVLLPIAENAIAGNSYRPGDVLQSRKGTTVEICDTDAEGRLVVADALTYACEEKPDLLIDFCTLTGAARVALGYDIPAFFSNNDIFIDALRHSSIELDDPVWPLPLWQGYLKDMNSSVADICNEGKGRGGAIEAALFLESFIDSSIDWIHLDCFAWELNAKPGRPHGGADTGMRAIFNFIQERYA